MGDYLPVYQGVPPMTKTASATIVGGQLVEATTTGAVGPAGAASVKVLGVAAHDAATGTKVTVHPLSGNEHEVTTPAGVTVGQVVIAAAAGTVNPVAAETGFALVGLATTTATAGNKVRFMGR